MSSKLPQALGFLADVVRHPTFKQEEIDRLRQQNVDALSVAMKQPGRLASFVHDARDLRRPVRTATTSAARRSR